MAVSYVKLAATTKERGLIAMNKNQLTVEDIIYKLIEDRKHDYDTAIHLQYIAYQYRHRFITECEALTAVLKIYWEW